MRALLLLASILLLSACGQKPVALEDLNATEVVLPNGAKIMAETMREQMDLVRGMMFRDSLAGSRGMLFVHPKEDKYAYWMYQTRIPLDIIWLDRQHHIVEISAATPPCPSKSAKECPTFGGHQQAQFVLEVNSGFAAKNGLRVGETLNF
jgi:uncharacterized membrane protein (UPF0127 family)